MTRHFLAANITDERAVATSDLNMIITAKENTTPSRVIVLFIGKQHLSRFSATMCRSLLLMPPCSTTTDSTGRGQHQIQDMHCRIQREVSSWSHTGHLSNKI